MGRQLQLVTEGIATVTNETKILVGQVFTFGSQRWAEHPDKSFEQVVEDITEKAREGKADAKGFLVLEVAVNRCVSVRPQITAVDVAEVAS